MRDWIAAAGLRRVDSDATHTAIPASVMADMSLSLEARGLYALLLPYQGQPIDPYDDAVEDDDVIAAAIEELIAAELAVRVHH